MYYNTVIIMLLLDERHSAVSDVTDLYDTRMPCYNNILVKTLMLSQLNRNARYRYTTKPCFLLFLLFIFIRVPVPRVDRGNVRLSQVRVRVAVVSRRGSMSFSHYIMHIIINNNMCRSVFVRFQEAFSLSLFLPLSSSPSLVHLPGVAVPGFRMSRLPREPRLSCACGASPLNVVFE